MYHYHDHVSWLTDLIEVFSLTNRQNMTVILQIPSNWLHGNTTQGDSHIKWMGLLVGNFEKRGTKIHSVGEA